MYFVIELGDIWVGFAWHGNLRNFSSLGSFESLSFNLRGDNQGYFRRYLPLVNKAGDVLEARTLSGQ